MRIEEVFKLWRGKDSSMRINNGEKGKASWHRIGT